MTMRPSSVILLDLPLPEDPKERRQLLKERAAALRREAWERTVERWGRRSSAVGNYCYSGALRVVQFPAYAFDLLDRYGKPDHSKIGPFLVSQELVALQAFDLIVNKHPLQLGVVVLIGVLSFASMSLMRKFLDKSKFETTTTTTIEDKREETITREYIEAHYTLDGVPAFSLPAVAGAMTLAGES